MDLSQFLIMEQSLFHLWCHPKRCSSFPPWSCVLQQAEQQARDVLPDVPSLPATIRHGGSSGRGATIPKRLFPPCWSWHRQAGQRAEFSHRLLPASPLRCPHNCKRNHTTCTKPKAFHTAICAFLCPRPLLANKTPVFEGRHNGVVQLLLRRRPGNGATAELLPSSPLLHPLILLFWFSDIYLSLNAQFPMPHVCFTKRLVN